MHALGPSSPRGSGSGAPAGPHPALLAILTVAATIMVGAGTARAAEALSSASLADSAGLGPTAAVPWNPPAAVGSSLPWETALRLPGRVATLPVSALGALTRRSLLVVEEKSIVPRVQVALQVLPRAGLVVSPASLGDRTGFGARVLIAPPRFARHGEIEYSGSSGQYSRALAALFAGPGRLEYRREWRPKERFYGFGMAAAKEDTTNFSSSHEALTLTLGRQVKLGAARRPIRLAGGVSAGGRGIAVNRGREDEVTPLQVAFPAPGGSSLFVGGTQWVGGAFVSLDGRNGRPHWSRGGRIAVSAERTWNRDESTLLLFEPTGLRLSDHQKLTAEAEGAVSFWRDPRTLRLLVRTQRIAPEDDSRPLPISELPTLGGSAGLTGFEAGRFRDRASVLSRLSYIFPLAQHFEMDLHVESGGVFPELSAARAKDLETSYGVLLRPRNGVAPIGMFGVEWCHEGVRVIYSLGAVE